MSRDYWLSVPSAGGRDRLREDQSNANPVRTENYDVQNVEGGSILKVVLGRIWNYQAVIYVEGQDKPLELQETAKNAQAPGRFRKILKTLSSVISSRWDKYFFRLTIPLP